MYQRRKMQQEKVLFPEIGPGQIEQQRSHFEANHHQQCAKYTVHEEELARINTRRTSTGRLLEGGNAIGNVAVIDVHRIDLGEAFQRRLRLAGRFLRYA